MHSRDGQFVNLLQPLLSPVVLHGRVLCGFHLPAAAHDRKHASNKQPLTDSISERFDEIPAEPFDVVDGVVAHSKLQRKECKSSHA